MSSNSENKPLCLRCPTIARATQRGHTKCLKYFLQTTKKLERMYTFVVKNQYGEPKKEEATLLYMACIKGYGDCVRILLKDERIDPNDTINVYEEKTILYKLCESCNPDNFEEFEPPHTIILLLLKHPKIRVYEKNPFFISEPSCFYQYVSCHLPYSVNRINDDVFRFFLDKTKEKDMEGVLRLICSSIYSHEPFTNREIFAKYIRMILDRGYISKDVLEDLSEKFRENRRIKIFFEVIQSYVEKIPVIKEPDERIERYARDF